MVRFKRKVAQTSKFCPEGKQNYVIKFRLIYIYICQEFYLSCPLTFIVIPDKGAQRPQIRYPAPLSKGVAFCLDRLRTQNKTLRVLVYALGSGSALAVARWSGMTKIVRFWQKLSVFFRPLSPLPISPPLCHKEGVNLIMLFFQRNHRGRAIYFYHAGRDETPENRKNVV